MVYTEGMGKRVSIQTELTTQELHERYRTTTDAIERTRLPYPVADEGGPHARGNCSSAWLYCLVGSHHRRTLESGRRARDSRSPTDATRGSVSALHRATAGTRPCLRSAAC